MCNTLYAASVGSYLFSDSCITESEHAIDKFTFHNFIMGSIFACLNLYTIGWMSDICLIFKILKNVTFRKFLNQLCSLLEAAVLFSTFRIRIKRKTGQKWCLTFFRSFWTDASSGFYLWQKFTLLKNCYQNSPQLLHKFKRINLYSLRNHQKTLGFFDDFRGILRQLIRFKGAVTDRYFVRSKFSRSLVHKKNFTLIWQVVFKLGYIFCQER